LSADLRSLKDMFAILKRAAQTTPVGRWVLGRGTFALNTQVVEKRMPTRQELDAISTQHPIILFSSVHEASLNTRAFKALGLWTEREQLALQWRDGRPRVGSLIYRDGAGLPTGLTTEIYDLILDQPLFPLADRMAAYGLHAREDYVTKGLTTVVNMSGQRDHIKADRNAQLRGDLPLRIRMFHIVPNADTLDRMIADQLRRGDGDDDYRFAGVKVFVDGDGDDGTGREITDLKWTQEQLDQTVLRCNLAGYPLVFHVVTKSGFDLALNSIANAEQHAPRRLRHQIHHLGELLANATDRARVKALGVTLGLTRADRGGSYPETIDYRRLLQEGIQPLCVSDSAGSFRHFSTLEGIASLVAPPGEGGVLPAGRTLTFDEALRMWTTTSAYANYEEDHMGSISVGKLGDLSILSRDPRTLKGGDLFDVNVEAVVLGGRVVFERNPL
jgi:predicted amidohydrolase YtcJ